MRLRRWVRDNRSRIAYWFLVMLVAGTDFGYVHMANDHRHDNCVSRLKLHDGEFVIVDLVADKLHASAEQKLDAERALAEKVGPVPKC